MDVKARNKEIKTVLKKEFNVSVTGDKGSAYGWVDIRVTLPDPCPFKQKTDTCSGYCNDNGICKGNDKHINGGWGNTVRQLASVQTDIRARELIKGIEMYTYTDDFNSEVDECLIQVHFN